MQQYQIRQWTGWGRTSLHCLLSCLLQKRADAHSGDSGIRVSSSTWHCSFIGYLTALRQATCCSSMDNAVLKVAFWQMHCIPLVINVNDRFGRQQLPEAAICRMNIMCKEAAGTARSQKQFHAINDQDALKQVRD